MSHSNRLKITVIAFSFSAGASLNAATLLVPIVANASGVNRAFWSTEVRLINPTDITKRLVVTDWIGTPGWRASVFDVAAHTTGSVGGWDFAGTPPGVGLPFVGVAACEVDEGLVVQASVLAGSKAPTLVEPCPSYNGGGPNCPGPSGSGPILDGLQYTPAGTESLVPWLQSDNERRTNLMLVNPDGVAAQIVVTMVSQDGGTSRTATYSIPPHDLLQLNDLFGQSPWTAIREANRLARGAAASARFASNTRLLAIGYVISNYNNSFGVSTSRPAPQ